ncbi:MAG TPA: ATP synthase F1 subunit gamma [Candidatus Coprenecus avistercoris]|uniref:ATP synthase gamma chain n=1 Tax=Candidatus Coprenecus avistercoris TaxID=2840730 RepID=A0A9D1E0J8_9BACT|nr:ATP synthase F1 subunit gamma [Candidatus Coprenecus avistercoris]
MAALKELKERIASVQSTLKITSAMKMVASAKLLRVQSSMEALSEYERRFSDIVAALVSDPDVEVASPLTLEHGEKRRACLVALASDSSLCGAFNANALREAVSAVEELLAGGFSQVTVYPMGEKMVQGMGRYAAARGENVDICLDYRHLVGKHSFDGIIPLADRLMEDFLAGRCDRVCISRCHFHSMGRQVPMREQLLPFNRVSRANVDRTTAVDYILEPAPDTLLDALLPSAIRIILYNALLDSITAENAARMVAMQTATDNAEELSDDLTLEYNKRRQQAITSELADITSSAEG